MLRSSNLITFFVNFFSAACCESLIVSFSVFSLYIVRSGPAALTNSVVSCLAELSAAKSVLKDPRPFSGNTNIQLHQTLVDVVLHKALSCVVQ